MKIVIDSAIPFVEGVFEPYATVVYKAGSEICREDLADAVALMVRTRTRCDASLLEGTSVKIIASATIGTDHIDLPYCALKGIFVQNAAGCNAGGVMNYVMSAVYGVASRKELDLRNSTFGIIGVGNVGTRVEGAARRLGFNVLLNDPPRAEAEGSGQFCSLERLLSSSDIVSLHVPLNESTRGLASEGLFARMKQGAIFINSSRGEVVDEQALLQARPKLGAVVIDTWANEPHINREVLDICDIATPHIAGYSYQGKQNATAAAVRAVSRFLDLKELFNFFPQSTVPSSHAVHLDVAGLSQGEIASIIQYNYPIFADDFIFRTNVDRFEQLRSNYRYRREFMF